MRKLLSRLFKHRGGDEVKVTDPQLIKRYRIQDQFSAALHRGAIGRNLLKNGRSW